MNQLLTEFALIAVAVAFIAGLLLTSTSGSAKPVKIFLVVLTGIFVLAIGAGLVFSRGLLVFLLFQLIALIISLYFVVVIGAVCGGGLYVLLSRKKHVALDGTDLADYLPVTEFSLQENISDDRALARIHNGYYRSGRYQGQWYIHKSELTAPAPSAVMTALTETKTKGKL